MSFDDSIEEKQYTDESELNCWHFDHVFGRSVKGVNFLTALLEVAGMRLPCAVGFIKKDQWETDVRTGKQKRKSSKTKNELFRDMVRECHGKFSFEYILADSWYSSAENMMCAKKELRTDFVMALKSNRKAALSLEDKQNKTYIDIETLQPGQQTVEIWFEGLDFPLLLTKQVFKNVGRRGISQINQKQHGLFQIANKKSQDSDQSLCIVYSRLYKIRMAEATDGQKPFRNEKSDLFVSTAGSICRTQKVINTSSGITQF